MAEPLWDGDGSVAAMEAVRRSLEGVEAGMRAAFSEARLEGFRRAAERTARDTGTAWERVWDRMADHAGAALDRVLRTGRLGLEDLLALARAVLREVLAATLPGAGRSPGGILADILKGGLVGRSLPRPFPSLSIPGFAKGGVVRGPQVAMIGEGSAAEAVVPLPDGRAIPVRLEGGGPAAPAIHITQHFHGEAREAARVAPVMKRMVRDAVLQGQREARRTG